MTDQQTIAILMALAPAAPKSFEHAPQPERPWGGDYLEGVGAEAAKYKYTYGDPAEDTNLLMEARGLIEWFVGDGSGPMAARPAIEEAMASVLSLHPDTDKKALKKIGEQLIEALERFAADYDEYLSANEDWQAQREIAWRSQWAYAIDGASRP